MLLNADQIGKRVATLLDDPSQSQFDLSYLQEFINAAWDDLAIDFAQLGLQYEEVVKVLDTVPAGTTDLEDFQAPGKDLEAMVVPVKLEWKFVGADDTYYAEVFRKNQVLDVAPGTQGNLSFEWRGGVVYISPSSQPTTIRIRFKAFSLSITDPSDGILIGATNALAYKTAELLCSPAVRDNARAMQFFGAKGLEAKDNFAALIVKQKQRICTRFGSMSGRTRRSSQVVLRVNH